MKSRPCRNNMTIENCRIILKVHIQAAESAGKMEGAFSLLAALQAIDDQILLDTKRDDSI